VKSAKLMLEQNRLLRTPCAGRFDEVCCMPWARIRRWWSTSIPRPTAGSPNENFAREVMELFTLGEGNYSEQDVKEAARAFTGWSIDPASRRVPLAALRP
jgi:hypothetical protein